MPRISSRGEDALQVLHALRSCQARHHGRCCPSKPKAQSYHDPQKVVLTPGPRAEFSSPPMKIVTVMEYDPWAPTGSSEAQQIMVPNRPCVIWYADSNVRYLSYFDHTLIDYVEMQRLLTSWCNAHHIEFEVTAFRHKAHSCHWIAPCVHVYRYTDHY